MGAVLEDVAGGHGGAAETMHEDRLILALQEVQGQQGADEELQVRGLGERLAEAEVQERSEREKEERGDQKRAEIFNDKDGTPGNLGSCSIGGKRKSVQFFCSFA